MTEKTKYVKKKKKDSQYLILKILQVFDYFLCLFSKYCQAQIFKE